MTETATTPPVEGETEPAAAPEAPKDNSRMYGVFVEETVAVDNAENALAAIAKHAVEGQGSVTILVKAGRARADGNKSAIEKLAKVRDLEGDYIVIADSNLKTFPGVVSKMERTLTFGGE